MSFPSTIILDVYAGIGLSDRYSIQDGSPNMAWRRTEDTAQSTDVQNQLTLGEVDRVSKEAVNPFFWGLQPDDSNNSIVDVVKKAPTTKGLLRLGSLGRVQRALNLNGLTRDRFSELYSSPTVFPSHIKWTDVEDRKIKHLEGRFCTDGSIERPMKWRFE